MRRLIFALLCLLYACSAIAQTPGSVVITGEYITSEGCLAFLNNAQSLKKGQCSFAFVASAVKLTDLSCNSTAVVDTIINCTYSPIKKLTMSPATPVLKAGDYLLPLGQSEAFTNGCSTDLNIPVLSCGFNINLVGISLPNLVLTSKVSGGNTWLEGSYSAVKP
jgi:hypothetical protein